MAHPLFARLDRQLELVLREFDNVGQATRHASCCRRGWHCNHWVCNCNRET